MASWVKQTNLSGATPNAAPVSPGPSVGSVRATYPPRPIKVDGQYAAFPGVTRLADGSLLLVYRQGADHVASRDGRIMASTSTDLGRTWSTPRQLYGGTYDYRDPSVSTSPDRSRLYLTYFRASTAGAVLGMFLRISTDQGSSFGAEIRLDPNLYAGAITAPVVDDGSGTLRAVGYAKAASGDAYYSVYYFTSGNGGSSWTAARIRNGVADGREYSEPWLTWLGGTKFLLTHRYGNASALAAQLLTGSSWGSPTNNLFPGYSGRASTCALSSGTILLNLRRVSDGSHWVASSLDAGATWNGPRRVSLASPSGSGVTGTTYAAPIELNYGTVYMPLGQETDYFGYFSRVFAVYCSEGGGISTPLGHVLSPREAAITGAESVVWSDTFDGPNGVALGAPYTVFSGSLVESWGMITTATTDTSTRDSAVLETNSSDVFLEAELYYDGGSSCGIGLVFRYVDPSNYLFLQGEGVSGGVAKAWNMYRLQGGQLLKWGNNQGWAGTNDSFVNSPEFGAGWVNFKVMVRRYLLAAWINDMPMICSPGPVFWTSLGTGAYSSTPAISSALINATKHGFTMNPSSAGTQFCRLLRVRALDSKP